MRPIVLVLALFVAACKCDDRLIPTTECGKSCYPEDAGRGGVGECRPGLLACNDDGSTECIGASLPQEEICNGLDDNCDGFVDAFSDSVRLCSSQCGMGVEQCQNGRWTPCSAVKPAPEVCDNLDNDCDGLVDEISDLVWDGGASCYSGPPGSDALGICHAGSKRCVAGKPACLGDQPPVPEACNGLDDDCDGESDEGAAPNDRIDFVLVFDNSGSMMAVADALKLAARTWATKYMGLERRYALVAAPDTDPYVTVPTLVQDFADPATFAAAVQTQNGTSGSGLEPTLDALYSILDPSNPLGLSWRTTGNTLRVVVMFTDEAPQAYTLRTNGIPTNRAEVAAMLLISGYVFHVFTDSFDTTTWSQWSQLASAGGGRVWDIHSGPMDIERFLDQVIKTVACRP